MARYAYINGGLVVEVIEPFFKTEEMRPPAPPVVLEGEADFLEPQVRAEMQAAHDSFVVGEVPIAERFHPDLVAQLVEIPEGAEVHPGDAYAEGQFRGPPAPPAPTADQVNAQRDVLLQQAATRIAPLQDAVDLGEATAEETAQLTAWKQYRVALNRIPTQPGYPANVTWPTAPQ